MVVSWGSSSDDFGCLPRRDKEVDERNLHTKKGLGYESMDEALFLHLPNSSEQSSTVKDTY